MRSKQSRCFDTTERMCGTSATGRARCMTLDVGCFESSCSKDGKLSVLIKFGADTIPPVPCPTGAVVNLATALPKYFSSGKLTCPDNAVMCPSLSCGTCVHGRCWKGKCQCLLDYVGPICNQSVIPAVQN
eukprot:jgi/Chrzof1/12884/Cz07g11010.t1